MDIEAEKATQEQFKKLPLELQKALQSPQLPLQINTIAQKYELHIDQAGKLRDEIVMFMMGFSEPEEFLAHLVEDVGVSTEVAGHIAAAVGSEILIPIRDSMKNTDEANPSTPSLAQPDPPPKKAATILPSPSLTPQPKALEPHPADLMLSQKTVTTAPPPAVPPKLPVPPTPMAKTLPPSAPPTPSSTPPATPAAGTSKPPAPTTPPAPAAPPAKPYNADPYREPPE